MQRCTQCLIPDTRPDTEFVNGICSACLTHTKRKTIDWDARKRDLIALLDRHDGRCIVPSSGGKDSHFQVLTLLELGADVTIVTASTCMLTDIGRKNIENLARYARTIEVTPNRTVRAMLNRLGLELVGDISWPEHVSIFTTPFRVARDHGANLLFFGECPQAHYGGPLGSEEARQLTARWRSEFGGFLGLRPRDLVGQHGITERDMQDYSLPETGLEKIEAHFLGQYVEWDSHTNGALAQMNGFKSQLPTQANVWWAENLDNAMTGLHDHAMYRKFGYGRGAAQASVDIRNGVSTREAGMRFLKDRDGLFPFEYMGVPVEAICQHIGMPFQDLIVTLNKFTNWELFEGVKDERPVLMEFACSPPE